MLAVGPNKVIKQSQFASSTKPALSLIDHLLTTQNQPFPASLVVTRAVRQMLCASLTTDRLETALKWTQTHFLFPRESREFSRSPDLKTFMRMGN
jgi:hypothetical protein